MYKHREHSAAQIKTYALVNFRHALQRYADTHARYREATTADAPNLKELLGSAEGALTASAARYAKLEDSPTTN